jgi:transcriptional regulator with XRE-family HTH domain
MELVGIFQFIPLEFNTQNIHMAFGAELNRLIEASKYTIADFAAYTGVDVQRIYKWKQKDTNPKAADAQKIERAFSMTLTEFMELDKIPDFHIVPRETSLNIPEATSDLPSKQTQALINSYMKGKILKAIDKEVKALKDEIRDIKAEVRGCKQDIRDLKAQLSKRNAG